MIKDFSKVAHIYLASGYTDMRRNIDGLVSIVQQSFKLDPFENSIFLFCGKKPNRIKALDWEREFLRKEKVSPNMTLNSLVELYMEDMSTRLKASTIENKKNMINTKLLPVLGDITIRKCQNDII